MKRKMPLDVEFLLESLTGTPINKNNLQENPDVVEGGDTDFEDYRGRPGDLRWKKGETFFAAKNFSIIAPSVWETTHHAITRYARRVFNGGKPTLGPFGGTNINISNEKELLKDILEDGGSFNEYFNIHDEADDDLPTYRTEISDVLLGRLWIKEKIISFWADQKTVVGLWSNVKKLFDDNPKLGKLGEYKIDWVERSEGTDPFTPASSLEKSNSGEPGAQMNFFKTIFTSPQVLNKLSPEQLKKIRDKVHVMDPEMKAQIMKANHSELVNKGAQIADKLGMSVAEFRSLWSLDERMLNEDPDSLRLTPGRIDVLRKKGIDVSALKRIYYDADDAVGFLINVNKKLTIYNPHNTDSVALTHPDIGANLMGYLARPNNYKKFNPPGYPGVAAELSDEFDAPPGTDIGAVAILQADTLPKFVQAAKVLGNEFPIDGDVSRGSRAFIQGRIWLDNNVISFWSPKELVMSHFDLVEEFLNGMHKKKEEVAYQFIDSDHYYTYDELSKGSVLTRTNAEMQALMRKQHIDPKAKKKLAAMQGNLKQKGDAGWDFQAQKHAAMPALQESPDKVDIASSNEKELEGAGFDPRKMNGVHWKDPDAITFILDTAEKRGLWIAADQVVTGPGGGDRPNHASLMKQIAYFRQYPKEFEIKTFGSQPVLTSKPDANRLKVWIVKGGLHGVDFSGTEDFSAYLAMADWTKNILRATLPGSLILGRYWRNSKVISFWKKKSFVLENFKMVEDFLKSFSLSPKEVAYEFIDVKKVFAYAELFAKDDDKLKRGSEEIADLVKKQHTDPSAKKKLKDMGYYDTDTSKKKLGGFDTMAQKHSARPALQETPDRPAISPREAMRLKNSGFDVDTIFKLSWRSADSVCGILDSYNKKLLWIEDDSSEDDSSMGKTHFNLARQVEFFSKNINNTKIERVGSKYSMGINPEQKRLHKQSEGVRVYGVGFQDEEAFRKYVATREWDANNIREEDDIITFRYGKDSRFISFWNPKNKVMPDLRLIEKFLTEMGARPTKVAYQFINKDKVYLYDELNKDDDSGSLDPEEIAALQKVQHLDPAAKKKLAANAGLNQKASPGFDFQAKAQAAMPALQEILKSINISK